MARFDDLMSKPMFMLTDAELAELTVLSAPCGKCAAAPQGDCINGTEPTTKPHPQRVEEAKRRAKIQRDRADGQRFNRA